MAPKRSSLGRTIRTEVGGTPLKKDGPSPEKAREILKDGTVHGKKLTDKQRRFFGAKAGGK